MKILDFPSPWGRERGPRPPPGRGSSLPVGILWGLQQKMPLAWLAD